jgi:hypothetical protein
VPTDPRPRRLPPIRLSEQEAADIAEVAHLRRRSVSDTIRLLIAEELERLKSAPGPR